MQKFSITIPMFSVKHHGGTRILLQLANSLVEKGHNVIILTPEDKYAPIYPVDKRIQIKFTSRVGEEKIFYFKTLIEFIFKIPKVDFILANFFPTFYPSLLAEKIGKGKLIYFPQGIGETYPSFKGIASLFIKTIETFSFKFKVPIVTTSQYQRESVLKLNKNAFFKKIPFGLLENTFYPEFKLDDNKNKKKLLYFARKEKIKGLDDFLEALNILIKKNLKFELWLISREKEILSKFDYSKEKIKIKTFSSLDDKELRRIYSQVYLLVNSSWVEGFCLPVLEAMACGTPSVMTDSGGPKEYAIHNYNCLIVPPKRPDLLAKAIQKLLLDEQLREKLTTNGLESAKKYKFSKFAEEFERFLLDFK